MEAKSEFRNDTEGQIGVVVIDNNKERGIAVAPGKTIWLSESEQILTANAPRRDEDNPFTNGSLTLLTEASEVANRRPIGTKAGPAASNGNGTAAAPEQPAQPTGDDESGKQTEAKRQARAKKQAEQGVRPVEEVGASVAPSGNPRLGKRAPGEEVATPEAPAKAS